jgi:hypothetical protein
MVCLYLSLFGRSLGKYGHGMPCPYNLLYVAETNLRSIEGHRDKGKDPASMSKSYHHLLPSGKPQQYGTSGVFRGLNHVSLRTLIAASGFLRPLRCPYTLAAKKKVSTAVKSSLKSLTLVSAISITSIRKGQSVSNPLKPNRVNLSLCSTRWG